MRRVFSRIGLQVLALPALAFALASPAAALPDAWTGQWGTSAADCRSEGATDRIGLEPGWVYRYEWDCKIRREQQTGIGIQAEVTCSYGDQSEAGGVLLEPRPGGLLRITFTGGARFGRRPPVREVKLFRRCPRQ